MTRKLLYIELKTSQADRGPAWIGYGELSKSGRTVYFNGQALKRMSGGGSGNHYCVESHDDYWVSSPKKAGGDRHRCGRGPIQVESSALADYLALRGLDRLDATKYRIVDDVKPTDIEDFHGWENDAESHT